jgi:hypothetical protein
MNRDKVSKVLIEGGNFLIEAVFLVIKAIINVSFELVMFGPRYISNKRKNTFGYKILTLVRNNPHQCAEVPPFFAVKGKKYVFRVDGDIQIDSKSDRTEKLTKMDKLHIRRAIKDFRMWLIDQELSDNSENSEKAMATRNLVKELVGMDAGDRITYREQIESALEEVGLSG